MNYERLSDSVYRLTDDSHREYYKDGDPVPYPSVTSVAKLWGKKYGLFKWYADNFDSMEEAEEELNRLADIGSGDHDEIAALLMGSTGEPKSKNALSALAYVRDEALDVKAVEWTVFSEEPRYAGTIDLAAWKEGKPGVVDWKTGSIFETHLMQVAALVHACGGEWGQVVALDKPTKKGYKVRNVKLDRDFRRFVACLIMWWEMWHPELLSDISVPVLLKNSG